MKAYDLGKDSIKKLVFSLALPSMIAQLVNVLYSIIDRIYIGNIPEVGDLALAGVGVAGPLVTFISSFGTLIGLGGSILLAMNVGAGNKEKAKSILANSFYSLIVLGIVLTIIFIFTKDWLIMTLGGTAQTFVYANTYLTIYVFGTIFQLMAIGLNYFISAQGMPRQAMTSVLIGAICNIILDTVFVFFMKMGVAGAAYATVISQFFSFTYTILILFGKRINIKIQFLPHDFSLIKRIITLGINPFIIFATDSLIVLLFNACISATGGDMVDTLIAASAVVNSIFLLVSSPLCGISGGCQPIISYNHGAGDKKRVTDACKYIFLFCLVFCITMFILINSFPEQLANLFNSNPSVIAESVRGLRIYILMIIPMSAQYAFVDSITALGLINYSLPLSLFRKGTYVVSTFILGYTLGARFTFFAEPICDLLASTASTIVFLIIIRKYVQEKINFKI